MVEKANIRKEDYTILDHTRGARPLYQQIIDEMLEGINQSKWIEGSKFPTEEEFCEYYKVSRITVRHAINELVREGFLTRKRGKGTIVKSRIIDNYNKAIGLEERMKELGVDTFNTNIEIKKIVPPIRVCREFVIDENQWVYEIRRIQVVKEDGVVLAGIHNYLNPKLDISLNPKDYSVSLYKYLKEKKGIIVSSAKETIEAIKSNKRINDFLGVEIDVVLKKTRTSYDQNNDIVEFTYSYYPSTAYKYTVEFSLNGK